MGSRTKQKGAGHCNQGQKRAATSSKTAAAGNCRPDPGPGDGSDTGPVAARTSPVRDAGQRFLLIFASTQREAEQVAHSKKWPSGHWQHVTREEHVEMRHPDKLVIHSITGFHKGHPEYLDHHKALMMRLQVYGLEPSFV